MKESILAFFRRLFGFEQSVEKIVAPITKIANKLDAHSAAQQKAAQAATEAAGRALAQAEANRKEAARASQFKAQFLPAIDKL
ncbi:hypothetical protein [Mesorhizobium sp.]|uniref:hypothetical protein n=1 Tax=Mesorhizobium sp. TaxID=1871066 RepID=UPI000FE6AC07|nr:hypothetical protein [Mesorhizobium sp.]RWI35466.1 MAG: hypothetical protein EOR14_28605 [Mesorhizobium sp.]RWJ66365.1 MAG: hypothetical protein EOR34_28530 [Mesorhizobium sp.]